MTKPPEVIVWDTSQVSFTIGNYEFEVVVAPILVETMGAQAAAVALAQTLREALSAPAWEARTPDAIAAADSPADAAPVLDDAMLDSWESYARQDLAAGRHFQAPPGALLRLLAEVRRARGWVQFGTHAGPDFCTFNGQLELSADSEDGLPDWERHDDCQARHV